MQAEDPLFKRSDHEEEVNLDNLDQILLKLEHFAIMAIEASHETPINDEQILKEVKEALLSDEVTKSKEKENVRLHSRQKRRRYPEY